jgi:hypothetical protein
MLPIIVMFSQGSNQPKIVSSVAHVAPVAQSSKLEPADQEEAEETGGVETGEVGPATFTEEAANTSVEEDAANTTADSQDGDDETSKPYGGEDKVHDDPHHKAAMMLGVPGTELEPQNPAPTDASPDPSKNKRPPGRPKGAKDSRPRTRRRKAEISAIRNATAAGMPVGMGMGFPHHQVKVFGHSQS